MQFSFGAFVKLRKATINFIMSVGLSVCISVRPSTSKNWAPTGQFL